MYKVAPLSSSFMVIGMLGFMAVVVYTSFGKLDPTWGFTLGLFFVLIFVASMVSMTYAPIETLIPGSGSVGKETVKSTRKR